MARKDKNETVESNDANEAPSTVLTWGTDHKADLASLPAATVVALAQRGFTHVLGNEVAAAISARKKETNDDGSAKYSEEELAVIANDLRNEKLQAMVDGSLGVRHGGGPRAVGIDKVMRDIAIEELRAIAVNKKKTLPKKADELNPIIEARLAKHGDRIRAKADARIAEAAALEE